jgi:transposase
MENPTAVPGVVAWVGLDWSDQHHEIRLQAVGSSQIESFTVEQKPEALHGWVAELRARFPEGKIALALEQSRGAVIYALMNYDFLLLYPIPPKTVARYREAFAPSGAKSDPGDAGLLLELVQTHRDRLRAWQPDDERTRQLRLLTEFRRKTVDGRTRLTNELNDRLKSYFPQARDWAGDLRSPSACEFLRRWPTLEDIQHASRAELQQFYDDHRRLSTEERKNLLIQINQAQPLTRDQALVKASALMAQALAEQLATVLAVIKRLEDELQKLFSQHPDHDLFEGLPGGGEALAPRLAVAFGSDRDRYQSAQEIQKFSGVAPVTEMSGKTKWVHWRQACPKFLRQTFHEFASASRKKSLWARAYYEQKRKSGANHHAAIRSLAFKWQRVLYRCWKDRTPYDEERYLKSLKQHQSPLWLAAMSLSAREAHA